MKKRVILLWMGIGVALFLTPFLQAGEFQSLPPSDDPPGSHFGIIRFQEKREPSPFSLRSLDRKQITLEDLKGKPIMLTFWATWCPSCTQEVSVLEKFFIEKKDQLTILTMAIDGEREKKIRKFVEEKQITLPVLLDVKERVARTYGVRMIPTTFFINREGFLVGMIVGERDWSSPKAWPAIRELLSLR